MKTNQMSLEVGNSDSEYINRYQLFPPPFWQINPSNAE